MKRISAEDALRFGEQFYPHSPEKLAELLEIEVRRSVFKGDGWCLRYGQRTLIRINEASSVRRQRFTLAHELGHLILGIPSVVEETTAENYSSSSAEEKRVNEFAGQLLFPLKVAKKAIFEVPITLKTIEKLADAAQVSPVFLVRRLTALAPKLGLLSAATLHFEKQRHQWTYSSDAKMVVKDAATLLARCMEQEHHYRSVRHDKQQVFDATLFVNPVHESHTIFVQVLRESDCPDESREAAQARLEACVMQGMKTLKPSLEGCMGTMRTKVADLEVEQAVALFNQRYLEDASRARWPADFRERLLSADGQNYLKLRLEIWAKRQD